MGDKTRKVKQLSLGCLFWWNSAGALQKKSPEVLRLYSFGYKFSPKMLCVCVYTYVYVKIHLSQSHFLFHWNCFVCVFLAFFCIFRVLVVFCYRCKMHKVSHTCFSSGQTQDSHEITSDLCLYNKLKVEQHLVCKGSCVAQTLVLHTLWASVPDLPGHCWWLTPLCYTLRQHDYWKHRSANPHTVISSFCKVALLSSMTAVKIIHARTALKLKIGV